MRAYCREIVILLAFCTGVSGQTSRLQNSQTAQRPDASKSGSISGQVTGATKAATLTLSGADSAITTTNSQGIYSFSGLRNGRYVVAVSQTGYTFEPSVAPISIRGNSVQNQDFVATVTSPPTSPPPPPPVQHSVSLTWTATTTANPKGYNVYRATGSPASYARLNASPLPGTSYVDAGVVSGQTYFYVATTVDINNSESAYSNQATATIPSP